MQTLNIKVQCSEIVSFFIFTNFGQLSDICATIQVISVRLRDMSMLLLPTLFPHHNPQKVNNKNYLPGTSEIVERKNQIAAGNNQFCYSCRLRLK